MHGKNEYLTIIKRVSQASSVSFNDYKQETLFRRIDKRIESLGYNSVNEYLKNIQDSEIEILKKDFFIHFTNFFRDPEAFEILKNNLLSNEELLTREIRVWVAGCATGEEAYSMAILLEKLSTRENPVNYRILATDIDKDVIKTASLGVYTDQGIKKLSIEDRQRFFVRDNLGRFKIKKELRQKILFSNHNILDDPPFIHIDILCCRNLFIYLKPGTQDKVIDIFHYSLNKDGLLLLGQSEHIPIQKKGFKILDRKWRLYQSLAQKTFLTGLHFALKNDKISSFLKAESSPLSFNGSEKKDFLLQALLGCFAPNSLLINQNSEIIYTSGDLTGILEFREGPFDPKLFNMTSPPISDLIRDGLGKLQKNTNTVIYQNIELNSRVVDMTLTRMEIPETPGLSYSLLHFKDSRESGAPLIIKEVDQGEIVRRRIASLEAELEETKEQLQNTIEELQSSNEELLSSNEELQSTNEELQTVNKSLQESEDKFRRIVQDQSEYIIRITPDYIIEFANSSYCDFMNKKIEEVIGGSFLNYFHGESRILIENTIQSLTPVNDVKTIELKHLWGKNRERWERWTLRALFSQDDKIIGYQFTGRDETLEKTTEKALMASENRYKQLFTSMQSAFALHEIILDKKNNPVDYRFLSVNPAFESLTGLNSQEILGKRVKEVLPDTEDSWIKTYGKVAKTGQSINFDNFSAALGKHFHVYAFSPEKNQFAVIFTDVTAQYQNKKELIEAREAAERADRLKSQFLANMSHEIRTPMNAILGFSELLELDDITREEQKSYSHLIRANGDLLIDLINDIIDMSKIESGQVSLQKTLTSINNLMDEIYSTLKLSIPDRIEFRCTEKLCENEDIVLLDKSRLKQILTNLISNSRKYTQKGSIEFGCKRLQKTEELLFFVKDTGIGIAPEEQEIIFERFHQIDEMSPGAGLGLNISRGLTEIMGGKLWLESEKNKGTIFQFTIPYNKVENGYENRPIEKLEQEFTGQTIIIAEDNQTNYLLVKSIFRNYEMNLLHAKTGMEVLSLLKENQNVDMILMDVKMPEMNGFDATIEIRKTNPSIPIIALTAYASPEDRTSLLQAGCNDFISKPFGKQVLIKTMARYLKRSSD